MFEFFMKNGELYQKTSRDNDGTKFKLVSGPKGLQQQGMSVNHKSEFSGHLTAKKTEVRILPKLVLARTTPGRH